MDKDKLEHTHDNGITHSHEGGNVSHTHDDIPKIDCVTTTTYRS